MDYYDILLAKKLNGGGGGGEITPQIKTALLGCFSKVAWVDEHGQDYYDTLQSALYQTASLSSISAVYTQSGTVYDTDSLDSLKTDLVVTANWSDSSTSTVDSNYYTLSGTLTVGTSTITVTYLEKTTTFSVTVSASWDFEWDYTKGLPNNNGMTLASNSPTISLESNGLSVTTVNNSSSYAMYKYESISTTVLSKTIEEYVFTITTQTAQSGGGIRTYVGLGGTGASVKKVAQLLFSENGIQYLSESSWVTLSSTPFATGTEYTVRMEQTASNCIIFVNGTEIATLSTFREQVAYPQFGVYRGASALIKSFKLKFEA